MKVNTRKLVLGIVTVSALSSPAMAQDWEGESRDAWIDGKLEGSYLLNGELNNFRIDTDVENGNVTLNGTVRSEAHKELAGEIASNLEGVGTVSNNLVVGEEGDAYADNERDFSTRFFDMTTTVGLKSNFALNSELEAHEIDIDTNEGVVTLEGEVQSEAAKMLAEEIASGYDHVSRVDNKLRIVASN